MTDVRRENPLFDNKITILTSSSNSHDENEMNLTLKILPGQRLHGSQQEKVLYFEITDEDDLYFLYTLEVGEHDFHNLKRDQKLVIDFAGFSKKFIDLVRLCIVTSDRGTDGGIDSSPSYVAKLDMVSSIFSVVQMNEFNHVNHLSLQFRPGNDASIKLYLASSLQLALSRGSALQSEVRRLESACDRLDRDGRAMAEELRSLRELCDRESQSLANDHAEQLNAMRRAHLEEVSSLRRGGEQEQAALRLQAEGELREAVDKCSRLEEKLSQLSRERLELEFSLKRSESEVQKLQPESVFYKASLTDANEQLRASEKEKAQLEQSLARSVAKTETLEVQLRDKDEILQKAAALREAAERSREEAQRQLEVHHSGLEALQGKLKSAVDQIHRGNETIRQLQGEGAALKAKLQTKNEVIRKQEATVRDLRERVAELSRQLASRDDELAVSGKQRELLERELAEAKKNVAEGAELVQKNEEVINHLNEMLNSFQLGGGGGGWGSSFSPTTPSAPRRALQTPAGHVSHGGHFVYHDEGGGQADNTGAASLAMGSDDMFAVTPPAGTLGRSPHQQSFSQGRTPDSYLNASALTDREESPRSRHNGTRVTPPGPKSLLPAEGLNLAPLSGHSADRTQNTKSYYDGLLDIPWDSGPQGKVQHTHQATQAYPARTPGITQPSSRSGKKPVYSWQLDDFGRAEEVNAD